MAAVGNAYLTFPDLHTEVLVRILQHLGLGDLTRCTMVCHGDPSRLTSSI